jgi:cation diffusion facilitator CzcD-associated flavoprotein CzcO
MENNNFEVIIIGGGISGIGCGMELKKEKINYMILEG